MKIIKRLLSLSTAIVLGLSSLLVFNLPKALAAACNVNGGSGGGIPLMVLAATPDSIPDTTQKVGFEVTPVSTWTTVGAGFRSSAQFAKSDCTGVGSNTFFSINKDRVLTVDFYDSNRTGAFVSNTDYQNVVSGGNVTSSSNTSATFTYTISSMSTSTAQLVSIDLSNSGWVDVYLKSGGGSDTRMVSFKAATGTAKFLNANETGPTVSYDPLDPTWSSCSSVTGSAEADARVLADGSALGLTLTSYKGVCESFVTNSYNSTTKTAALKYDIAGAAVNHVFIQPSGGQSTVSQLGYSIYSSLAYNDQSKYFSDYFASSTSSNQQIYFIAAAFEDGKNIPKNSYYPIAGGIVDMSKADIDLGAKQITMDTSSTDHKAFIHNMNTITKDGTFTLFVPYKTGDTFVSICPGVSSLSDTKDKCTNEYSLKDGQSKTSANATGIPKGVTVKATKVTLGGIDFWQVEGLTGSGGFSSSIGVPDTGFKLIESRPLAIFLTTTLLAAGIALVGRRYSKVLAR